GARSPSGVGLKAGTSAEAASSRNRPGCADPTTLARSPREGISEAVTDQGHFFCLQGNLVQAAPAQAIRDGTAGGSAVHACGSPTAGGRPAAGAGGPQGNRPGQGRAQEARGAGRAGGVPA